MLIGKKVKNLLSIDHEQKNLLPFDGEVYHWSQALPLKDSMHFFDFLLNETDWKSDEIRLFGKHILMRRKMAWFANQQLEYTYSNIVRKATPWNSSLLKLKSIAEEYAGHPLNSCLLNLYHDGRDGMGWHSDNESTLNSSASIVSISLGATRRFLFKHGSSKVKVEINLASGDLVLMKPPCQRFWKHSIPKSTIIYQPRINLTFREIQI